jgi:hypothetical protein
MAKPTALVGGTVSPSLAAASFPGELGKLYREARGDLNASIRSLMYDLIKQGGREGAMGMIQGKAKISEEQTQYVLLHAERLAAMLAHLHAARLLAEQSQRFPERLPLAERAMRRAAGVCADASRSIKSGDKSALAQIAVWQDAS